MNLPFKQRGVGIAGWMVLILLFGAAITMGTKLAPLYMDHSTISNILDKMETEPDVAGKSKRQLYDILEKRLKLNNIREFNLKDNMEIERVGDGTRIIMDYESRVPFFGNVDLVASFKKEVELRN